MNFVGFNEAQKVSTSLSIENLTGKLENGVKYCQSYPMSGLNTPIGHFDKPPHMDGTSLKAYDK